MKVVLVAHNIRSTQNVGGLFRTADGLGIDKLFLTGYSPYPEHENDNRLPHERRKIAARIHKTALGAEKYVEWEYQQDFNKCLNVIKQNGFTPVALEQTKKARMLNEFTTSDKVALIVGNEISGLENDVLNAVDNHIQIPMHGRKESLNVTVAAAITLYQLKNQH